MADARDELAPAPLVGDAAPLGLLEALGHLVEVVADGGELVLARVVDPVREVAVGDATDAVGE